ncbi:MAG: GTPase domain-containing protein [Deltaproteobacteria bacterium]|nr:GTPase domain-containing protein [Deltaproteobacteria bacterium]
MFEQTSGGQLELTRDLAGSIQCPGLSIRAADLQESAAELSERLRVYYYKQSNPLLWSVFLGGTGTGKSTLFNALLGELLSDTGVERPKTKGPVVWAPRGARIDRDFPFPAVQIDREPYESIKQRPVSGRPGQLVVVEYEQQPHLPFLVVDTPDLDSVEVENRAFASQLYLLADVVLFVSSQEKYADEIPYKSLLKTIADNKPCYVLVNKADGRLGRKEVLQLLARSGVSIAGERLWLIPYVPSQPWQSIAAEPEFRAFRQSLLADFSGERLADFTRKQSAERLQDLVNRIRALLALLAQENDACQKWLSRLDALYEQIARDLVARQKEHFSSISREYLQREIRQLYTRYDVLAKPRRFIRELLLTPLRLLGFRRENEAKVHDEALLRIRRKLDQAVVHSAVEQFNRAVLEQLSPGEATAPLFRALRDPAVLLTDEEIKQRLTEQQDQLIQWLEDHFKKISRGISKEKELGIYSTSVLWGLLLLSFEAAVGGGLTLVDAAVDTAVAPFLTKGAVELFAYHEIQRVGRKLAKRYEQGLLSVLQHQRDLYRQSLQRLMTANELTYKLEELCQQFEDSIT